MFIPDLSQFPDYPTEVLSTRSIGWLSGEFTNGQVPKSFGEKLSQVESNQELVLAMGTAGFHPCEYCHPDGKIETSCSMFISQNGFVWPEMLAHYVRDHGYKPPDEFVKWVMEQ